MVSLRQLEQGMQQLGGYYKSNKPVIRHSFSQGVFTNAFRSSFSKSRSKAELKSLAAKKHSEAERKRRVRINGQYATLRTILPNLVKMDKASVLGETIRRLRELKEQTSELESRRRASDEEIAFPSESDKLNLEEYDDKKGLKATLSCEDRPELMSAVARAIKSVNAKIVKAEMVTLGGRTKSVLYVEGLKGGSEGMQSLRRALKVVIQKPHFPGMQE